VQLNTAVKAALRLFERWVHCCIHNQGGTASKLSSLSRDGGFFVFYITIRRELYETAYRLGNQKNVFGVF
jgi:hypothetical protein